MDSSARRQLLKFLVASPLLYCTAAGRLLNQVRVAGNETDPAPDNDTANAQAVVEEGGYTIYLPLVLRQR